MDKNKRAILQKKIDRMLIALRKNNMQAFYAETKEEVVELVDSILHDNDSVSCGGSVSLAECGVIEHLRSGKYNFLDRSRAGLSPEQIRDIYIAAFNADAFLCSANAITENGELYNVDGNSNRVAALLFGPRSVIVIAGYNKIVRDLDDAVRRVKTIAAPANCTRLQCATYCNEMGTCKGTDSDCMTAGCESDARICCNYVVSAKQRHKDRIKVILVGEELGF